MRIMQAYELWKKSEKPVYCYVIAEIGINHNGSISIAKDLIRLAKNVGCDAVKFQKRTPDICVPVEMKELPRETPWGQMSYLEYKKRLEFSENEFNEIDQLCKELDIEWSASAWDEPSQLFLRQYNLPFNKIASAMLTNLSLLELVASEHKPTFVSTGMSELSDIDKAVDIFQRKECPFILMHTVSTYPAKNEDLNLMLIETLKRRYSGIPIGYSGHEVNVSPSVIAVALGAVAVERHITLDRSMYGTDQSASLEKRGLEKLVSEIRRIPHVLGNGIKSFGPDEQLVAKKLRPNSVANGNMK
jgi:N-acetylneuraminate synthase